MERERQQQRENCYSQTTSMIPRLHHGKRPTHFLCFRIENDIVKDALLQAQQRVVEQKPILAEGLVPTILFHITLAVFRFEHPNAMAELCQLLNGLQPQIRSALADPQRRQVSVKGLSTFNGRVL